MAFMACDDCGGAQRFPTAAAAEEAAHNHQVMYGHMTRTSSEKVFEKETQPHVTAND